MRMKMRMRMRMKMTMTWRKNFYVVNNSTDFDIFALLTPPKPMCVVLLQHFDD